MSSSDLVLQSGVLQGKLPGMREWNMYYLEVTPTHLHIMDEQGKKHLRSLEVDNSDMCGEDTKSKREFRFYLLRGDGKYTFRCESPHEKSKWIEQLQRVIQRKSLESLEGFEVPSSDTFSPSSVSPAPSTPRHIEAPKIPRIKKSALDTPLPPAPGLSSPRSSVISTDSGFGASEGGEVKGGGRGFRSAPASGDGRFRRGTGASSKSGDSTFDRSRVQVVDEGSEMGYERCKWFWSTTSRHEAERRLLSEGKIGNFIVRINASGHFVMTYWRNDGIHHHKILNHGTIFRFEKSAVDAEGESLVDLLDTYMKKNSSKAKPMEPFGGVLYENYNYAWNPPSFDMNLLEERLKEQKRLREEAAKASQRPGQYIPVDLLDSSSSSSREDSGSGSVGQGSGAKAHSGSGSVGHSAGAKARGKTLPPQHSKRVTEDKLTASVEEKKTKTKPLPPPPNKKPTNKTATMMPPATDKSPSALIQELKLRSDKPSPRTKPKPSHKPGKAEPQTTPTTTSYEPPEYANCNFGPEQPPEDESVYMNVSAPAPPVRRPRGSQPAPSEYQNIGTHLKSRARH